MATDFQKNKELFKNLVPLDALSDGQLDQLIKHVTIDQAANEEILFREGDEDQRHFYLLQGQIQLLSGSREVELVKSGTQPARFALAHQWPRKFSGRAVGDVHFVRIQSRVLHSLVVRNTQSKSEQEDADVDWMTLALGARVLQQVPPSNIQNVLRRMEEVIVKAGEVVIRQGEPGEYYYILAKGTGVVTRTDPAGERQLAVLASGDGFGEDALISGELRAASVTMASNGRLIRLPKNDFLELIRRPLVQGIRIDKARKLIEQGAIWLDIRHPEEYAEDHFSDALNLPLETLRERCETYPKDKQYIVYGLATESAVGTFLLRERSFNVLVLENWNPEQNSGLAADSSISEEEEEAPDEAAALKKQQDVDAQIAKYQQILSEKVAEIQQLSQKLNTATTENQRLEKSLKQALQNSADASADKAAPLQQRIEQLELKTRELQEELDTTQDILQDATAQESTLNWKNEHSRKALAKVEKELQEQREANRVLREEK